MQSRASRGAARARVLAVAAWALATTAHGALDAEAWKHRQTFTLQETGVVKLALPLETLDLARPGWPDLRVVGPAGREVPYAVTIAPAPEPVRRTPRDFQVQLEKESTRIAIETGVDEPLLGIELATAAREFVKAARVEISADRDRWQLIGEGFPLVRENGAQPVSLPLDRVHARWVRITLDDWRTLPVAFSGATLTLAPSAEEPTVPLEPTIVAREEFAGETLLTLDLHARQVPVAWLEFEVAEPWFSRAVTLQHRVLRAGESGVETVATGLIGRSQLPQARREQLRVTVNRTLPTRELQVRIRNGNSALLTLPRVTVHRRPVWLILYVTEPGVHRLLTGNPQAGPPSYDLAPRGEDFSRVPETPVKIGPAEANPDFRKKDVLADTPLLGPALDVRGWKFRKTVTPAAAGVQELELDVEVLAHAQRTWADLRLWREGRQIPYLLERTPLRRSLRISPVAVGEPNQPRVSRWEIALPVAGLPLKRLTLSTTDTLFSRNIRVFEVRSDRRGEIGQRDLAERRIWSSTPDNRTPQLTIELHDGPQSERIQIETDNGDNPPLTLGPAQVEYPVVRVLFRSEAAPLHLYYGSAAADPPRYDLELAGPLLLEAEKVPAVLGSQEETGGGGSMLARIPGGGLLWSALAVVVVVLLFVIARLLPKAPEPER